jgi:uncharacterized protein
MFTPLLTPSLRARLGISPEEVKHFCERWNIRELALFGSVLRDDFLPDSDIDVLISLAPNHSWGLEFIQMREELSVLLGRPVDLLTRQSIEHSRNLLRRQTILNAAEVIYVAG